MMNIYFDDFKPEVQEKILKFLNIKSPEERNYDIFPIFNLLEEYDYEDDIGGLEELETIVLGEMEEN